MHRAVIELKHPNAKIIYRSLLPESRRTLPRTKVILRYDEGKLIMEIFAEDISALRASLNSYLRWINTSLEIMEVE